MLEEGESDISPGSRPQPQCYSCGGHAVRLKRVRESDRWVRVQVPCNACRGAGFITRSRRKDSAGNFIKKRNRKSYPSFIAPGPMPMGSRGRSDLTEGGGEELCFLVGNWRLFQQISSHRYSTDDLVTTWVAAAEARNFGHTGAAAVLDIGCGIGSVLLSTAWQLPDAICVGMEAQPARHAQAVRSVSYNVGEYPAEQTRIRVINSDMRDSCPGLLADFPAGFDIITGTPPYFGVTQGVLPGCLESAGCLFELRGGVEVYCAGFKCTSAAQYLRRPNMSDTAQPRRPSVFVMCNTSLASSRVYIACEQLGLSIIRSINVVPVEGKPPLFTVFVIILDEWIRCCPEIFPILEPCLPAPFKIAAANAASAAIRVDQSLRGEEITILTVRRRENKDHTTEYQSLLRDLGKPSSADREIYDI